MKLKNSQRHTKPVLRKYIRIMRIVIDGNYNVSEIAKKLNYDRATVSRYLKVIEEEIPEIQCSWVRIAKGGKGGKYGKVYRWVK